MTASETSPRRRWTICRAVRVVAGLCAGASVVLALCAGLTRKMREIEVDVEATLPEGSSVEFSADPAPRYVTASEPSTGERQRFEFTSPAPIRALRVDPGTLPATSRVHSVEIRQGGAVLRTFSGRELSAWTRIGIEGARLLEDGSLEITNRDNDPQLVAPPLDIVGRRGTRLGDRLDAMGSNGLASILALAVFVLLLASAIQPFPAAGNAPALREIAWKYDVLLPVLAFTLLFALHAGFRPLWDSQWYASCLDEADPGKALNCLDHDPYPYMALLLLPLATLGKWYGWVHLVNWACGVGGIILFRKLFQALSGPATKSGDVLLATGLFAVNPLFVVSALNLNLDWPLLIAGLGFLYFWLEQRARWAAVFGLLLCFSKITGAAVYFALLFGFAALTPLFPLPATRREKALLLAPGATFLAVQLMHRSLGARAGLPEGVPAASLPSVLFSIDLASLRFGLMMKGISLLNFSWVLLPFIGFAAAASVAAIYFVPALRARLRAAVDRRFLLLCVAFLASVYVASRVFLYLNPRYLLLAHVLYLLIGMTCLTLVLPRRARTAVGAALILLVSLSNFRTIDPIAKRAFGTFRLGEHEILALGRQDGMNPAPGRDQLVYSPEITVVHDLLQDLYRKARPDRQTLFVASMFANANHFAYFDPRDFSRVPFASRGVPVLRSSLEDAVAAGAEQFVVVEEPYFGTGLLAERVSATYQVAERIPVVRSGYRIDAIRFRRTAGKAAR